MELLADTPILLAGLVAAPCKAETTLLGIVETPSMKSRCVTRSRARRKLAVRGCRNRGPCRRADPRNPGANQVKSCDITIIGARRKTRRAIMAFGKNLRSHQGDPDTGVAGHGWRIAQASSFARAAKPIDTDVELTGKMAAAGSCNFAPRDGGAAKDLRWSIQLEEDVSVFWDRFELGRNCSTQKQRLEARDPRRIACARVRARPDFCRVSDADYDLIVTGSSPTRDRSNPLHHGRRHPGIVNRANVPVLVARSAKAAGPPAGCGGTLKQLAASSWGKPS